MHNFDQQIPLCGPLQQNKCVKRISKTQRKCLAPCQGLIVSDITAEVFQNETVSLLGDLLEEYEKYKRQFQDEVVFPEQLKSRSYTFQPANNIFDCISMQNFNLQRPENIQFVFTSTLRRLRGSPRTVELNLRTFSQLSGGLLAC